MKNTLLTLKKELGANRIRHRYNISSYLTMRLSVVTEFFFEAKTDIDIIHAIKAANELHIPWRIIGGGSNSVFTSSFISGLTIKNSYMLLKIHTSEGFKTRITVSSGFPMSLLVEKTVQKGFSGFEYHKGLPGQLGGAVYMNSKWTKPYSAVGDTLNSARVVDRNGDVKEVKKDYFAFAYDYSILQKTKEILLKADFILHTESVKVLQQRANFVLTYRKNTQPIGVATCGCFFRNISDEEQKKADVPTKSAGYLIDKSGLKNLEYNDFSISPIHANFIVHKTSEGGRPEDLLKLVGRIKKTVQEKYGIVLIEEVEYLR